MVIIAGVVAALTVAIVSVLTGIPVAPFSILVATTADTLFCEPAPRVIINAAHLSATILRVSILDVNTLLSTVSVVSSCNHRSNVTSSA